MFNINHENNKSSLPGTVSVLPQLPAPVLLDGIVYKADLCRWLGKSTTTLWRWVKSGDFPAPRKLGQCDIWPATEIAQWARDRGFYLDTAIRHISD